MSKSIREDSKTLIQTSQRTQYNFNSGILSEMDITPRIINKADSNRNKLIKSGINDFTDRSDFLIKNKKTGSGSDDEALGKRKASPYFKKY